MTELKRINPERRSNVSVDRGGAESLGVGLSEGKIDSLKLTVFGAGGREKTISMAEKLFYRSSNGEAAGEIERILDNHAKLKQMGVPTIPTMRLEGDGGSKTDRIYMTDLTEGGKNEVLSPIDWWLVDDKTNLGLKAKFHESQSIFSLSNPDEVQKQILDIHKILEGKRVFIGGTDVPFIVLNKKTKQGRVILGDIESVKFEVSDNELLYNWSILNAFVDNMNKHLDEDSQIKMDNEDPSIF